MKLITEHNENIKFLTEGEKGDKKYIIEGIFMQAEQKNRNGRIYPKAVLESAVDRYVKEYVSKGRAVGELNHPEGPAINLDKVSHRITELRWDKNDVYGKALILNTPMGNIAKGLLEGGCQLGVSSRGMGSVSQTEGTSKVNDDFILATVDIVQDPSAPSAFVNGIMEGVEYFYKGNVIVAVAAEQAVKKIKKLNKKQLVEQQAKIFKDFLTEISVKF
jgi:hypothetical protein